MPSGFFDRLVARIDKLDSESLQTQMKRLSQERVFLEAISQTIQEGVLVIDNEGTLLYANRAAEKMTGLDFARTKGRSVLRLLRDWDWEHLLDVPSEDEHEQREWMRMVTREIEVHYPTHRYIHFYAIPFNQSDVDVKSVLIILRDVSNERKQEASSSSPSGLTRSRIWRPDLRTKSEIRSTRSTFICSCCLVSCARLRTRR